MPFDRAGVWTEPDANAEAAFVNEITTTGQAIELPADMQAKIQEAILSKANNSTKVIEHLNRVSYATTAKIAGSHASIVVPIYGALPLVKKCVESIFQHTQFPYELILVDDCSPDPAVRDYLNSVDALFDDFPSSKKCVDVKVIFNKKNKGFAATCNIGMRASTGQYICIHNSDVIVTPDWLTKMVLALEADPSHVIVNPCTNNTALINVPMEPGRSYLDMNRALERKSPKNYPEIMPTGFCLFFRRALYERIGGFDEAFVSYGEDTHFWFQSLKLTDENGQYLGNKAVLADDCYIFHERSSSFNQVGAGVHMGLRRAGSERFHGLNPGYADWKSQYNVDAVMHVLRQATPPEAFAHTYKYNFAWVVKSAEFCGGMKYISDIVNELIERNVNAKVVVVKNSPNSPENVLTDLHTQPIFFKSEEEFVTEFATRVFSEGVVVAAVSELVNPVGVLCSRIQTLVPIHHVQSYDPELTDDPALSAMQAEAYGKLRHTISSSNWITQTLKENHKVDNIIFTTQPGVDTTTFHPGDRSKGDDRFTVMVALNPQYPFKGANRGVEVCREILKRDKNVRVLGLGMDYVSECPTVVGLGKLSQGRLAHMLRTEVDVFIDPSFSHSYGMPSLEALACGVEIVCWNNKGVLEYANNKMPGVHIFTQNVVPSELADRVIVIRDNKAVVDIKPLDRADSVNQFITNLETALGVVEFKKRITVVTPHARKNGGPTTIINLANILKFAGHDVKLVSIYDDFNNEVIASKRVPLYVGINSIKESDVIIVNSDNPFIESIVNQPALKDAKKVLLKLSHNPRFKSIEEASLRMPIWDKILTSTEHLREKTINPIQDWRHIAWSPDKVKTIGWYHYGFNVFNLPPESRSYGNLDTQMRIAYLMHDHPTKGSSIANAIVKALKRKYGSVLDVIAIGEVQLKDKPPWLTYIYRPTRSEMASVLHQCDVWLGSSLSEGLGRMTLEAMSAGCAVVTTDTGAEFLRDKDNCLLYPVGDAQAGGTLVDQLLGDTELFKKLVTSGYDTAKKAAEPYTYIHTVREAIRELY